MDYEVSNEQLKRVYKEISLNDADFFNEYLADLTLEMLADFLKEFPEFGVDLNEDKFFEKEKETLFREMLQKARNLTDKTV